MDEYLSVEDVYDIIEVATVDGHNTRLIQEHQKNKGG